jgi:hypothetical protein
MQSTKQTSEPGKNRTDNLRCAGQEMRDSGSSDLFDAQTDGRRFRCSSRSAGRQDACTFATDDEHETFAHFEQADHDVDERAV